MFKDDEWITPIQGYDFLSMFQNGQFDNNDCIDPKASARLKKMAGQLKENDNPVIIIVKPKSNLKIWN